MLSASIPCSSTSRSAVVRIRSRVSDVSPAFGRPSFRPIVQDLLVLLSYGQILHDRVISSQLYDVDLIPSFTAGLCSPSKRVHRVMYTRTMGCSDTKEVKKWSLRTQELWRRNGSILGACGGLACSPVLGLRPQTWWSISSRPPQVRFRQQCLFQP